MKLMKIPSDVFMFTKIRIQEKPQGIHSWEVWNKESLPPDKCKHREDKEKVNQQKIQTFKKTQIQILQSPFSGSLKNQSCEGRPISTFHMWARRKAYCAQQFGSQNMQKVSFLVMKTSHNIRESTLCRVHFLGGSGKMHAMLKSIHHSPSAIIGKRITMAAILKKKGWHCDHIITQWGRMWAWCYPLHWKVFPHQTVKLGMCC